MIYLILLVGYFIICQVIVAKIPRIYRFLKNTSASAVTLQGMLVIGLVIALCILCKLSWIPSALVTIFECSLISKKYRLVFEQMEKGEKI